MTDLETRIETAKRRATHQRNYRRVRDRALARLRQLHPEEYEQLFQEERERDEAEGKAWLDLSGRTRTTTDSSNSPNRTGRVSVKQTNSDRI